MPKVVVRVIDAYVFNRKSKEIRFLLLKRAKTKIYEHLWQGVAAVSYTHLTLPTKA